MHDNEANTEKWLIWNQTAAGYKINWRIGESCSLSPGNVSFPANVNDTFPAFPIQKSKISSKMGAQLPFK